MAHVTRAIELDGLVDDVHEQWLRFEALPRCALHAVTSRTRWRAEVLTFEPRGARTRVELRIELERPGADPGLPQRMEAALGAFTSFCEAGRGGTPESRPA